MNALQFENYKTETFSLTWGEREPAGVAFYDLDFGEYRLKIDLFTGLRFCLKFKESNDTGDRYQLDVVLKDQEGNFRFRKPVGNGFRCRDKIVIEVFALEKPLILKLGGDHDY